MGYEHNWNNLEYPASLLTEASRLIPANSAPLFAGISFHCYRGSESAQLAFLHDHPTSGIWFTECSGTNGSSFATDLLWQAHHLLLGAPLNEARSVLLWNIALDPHGDPHNGGCGDCRALFTIESHDGNSVIQRNVEYYELAHAAPFIHPGAVRIAAIAGDKDLQTVAYQNLDGTLALLVLNSAPHDVHLDVQWHGQNATYDAPARSLLTFSWGTPVPFLDDGTFRLAIGAKEDRFLEATSGTATPATRPYSKDTSESSRQLWKLHRLADGRFEIRNVATAQSLGLTAAGKLMSPLLDGSHVASLPLRLQANGVCLTDSSGAKCTEAASGISEFGVGTLFHLLAP
jgi:glucosylceramidase